MIKRMLKQVFVATTVFLLASSTNAYGNTTQAIEKFLLDYPSFFYDDSNINDLKSQVSQAGLGVFDEPCEIEVIDIFQDGSSDIILSYKRFENYYAHVYFYDEQLDKYIKKETIDASYKFFKDGNDKTTLFEGSRNSMGVKYSYIYKENSKFLKDIIYYDNVDIYNRIEEGVLHNREKLINNPKILDETLVPTIGRDFSPTMETVRKKVLEENKDKSNIKILVNQEKIEPDTVPIIENERVLVPIRTIATSFQQEVEWNDGLKKASIIDKDKRIDFFINQKYAFINGVKIDLDVAPIIHNSYTMLPVRFIIETLGGNVLWLDDCKTAYVDYYFQNEKINGDYYDEEIAKEFKKIIEVDVQTEGTEKFMLWTNEIITNLRITKVTYEEIGEDYKFVEGKDYYKKDSLNQDELIVIKAVVPEGVPNIQISYVDEYGVKKAFTVSYDGLNGGVIFGYIK